jgi:hypothetical protein
MTIAAPGKILWPEGARFAFTIVDDTDQSTLDRVRPIYEFLGTQGFRTTKTVWPLSALSSPITGGDSLENDAYRLWVLTLRNEGFEIALHGVADGPSKRDRILLGLDRFNAVIGQDPEMHINHVGQTESLYWGEDRFNPPLKWAYRVYRSRQLREVPSLGHVPTSDYFWGDLCKQRIRFVRNLVWPDINTLKADPLMPYYDPNRPFVRAWFSSSYGSGIGAFLRLLSPANQDRLMQEGGACIVYTHLGSSFHPMSREFKSTMQRLASMPGWFVPASKLLQYIGEQRGWSRTSDHRWTYQKMQLNWLFNQFRRKIRR